MDIRGCLSVCYTGYDECARYIITEVIKTENKMKPENFSPVSVSKAHKKNPSYNKNKNYFNILLRTRNVYRICERSRVVRFMSQIENKT